MNLLKPIVFPLFLTLAACGPPQRNLFQINMQTQSDDGYQLAGVTIWHGEQELGTTNSSGLLEVSIEAEEDSNFAVRFDCPKGFSATRNQIDVPLRKANHVTDNSQTESTEENQPTAQDTSAFALTLECRPDTRTAMIVVQANMANVPVMIGKKTIAVTNDQGIAHASVQMTHNDVFEIHMDTSTSQYMQPRNPEYPFVMPNHDEVFVVSADFSIVLPPPPPKKIKKKKKKKKKVIKERVGPIRISSKKK